MNGKEIKKFILNQNDTDYNIEVYNEYKRKVKISDINDNLNYFFNKIDEFPIGCGMIIAYYSIKRK